MFSKRIVPYKVVLGLATALLVMILSYTLSPRISTHGVFSEVPSPLSATYDLFDLGVADVDDNGFLDIFTLNHSAIQNLLLSKEGSKKQNFPRYDDALVALNLSQDHNFSDIEDRYGPPQFDQPGLYIYRQNFQLHLKAHQLSDSLTYTGELQVSLPIELLKTEGFDTMLTTQELTSGAVVSTLKFSTTERDAHLVIEDFPELPHRFAFEATSPVDTIFLGHSQYQPAAAQFELMWRDRHTMAWNDTNADGRLDVFIGRGAVRGNLANISEDIEDELFISDTDNGVMSDRANELGLEKSDCPARQSAWVDYNNDGLPDLYISCGRGKPGESKEPNQLYEKQANGSFTEVAAQHGVDLPGYGPFQWLDLNADGKLDLIASEGKTLSLFLNRSGGPFEKQAQNETFEAIVKKLSIADFDADNDFDIYVVTAGRSSNKLLINEAGRFTSQPLAELGLPVNSLTANWIDYDNDGLMDLLAVPEGIYRQQSQGGKAFVQTGILSFEHLVRATWNTLTAAFDANNDGFRDVLIAYQQTPSVLQPKPNVLERVKNQLFKKDTNKIWQSVFYKSTTNNNHWLTVQLIGPKNNINAIGATVTITTENHQQVQYVGQHDDALYSQGHYQLYFGLGNYPIIQSIEVKWPDNTTNTLENVQSNQILEIPYSTDSSLTG